MDWVKLRIFTFSQQHALLFENKEKKIYTDKMASFRDYIEALVGTSSQNIIVAEV